MSASERRGVVSSLLIRLPLPSHVRFVLLLAWDTVQSYGQHRAGETAAAIAYYALFSVFPLILFVIAALGFLLKTPDTQERIIQTIAAYLPGSEDLLGSTIRQVIRVRGPIGVVAAITLLWSGSGVFSALATAIGRAWREDGGRPFWKQRLVGLALAAGVGLLILLAIISSSFAQIIGRYGRSLLPPELAAFSFPLDVAGFTLAVVANLGAFFIAYMWLPGAPVPARAALLGAATAGLTWEVAKGVCAWYLSTFAVNNFRQVYGPVEAVLAFLLWTYVSAAIVLLGAELSATYARTVQSCSDR